MADDSQTYDTKDQRRQSLATWVRSAKLVRVEVPAGNAWLDGFGCSADDPEFPAFLEELQKARFAPEAGPPALR